MSESFVSIRLPVYDRDKSLIRAIDSVLPQDSPPDELIVVDNDLEEDPSLLPSQYARRVISHRQPKEGVASERSAAAQLAKGNLLTCVDPDKQWTPDQMETRYRNLPAAQSEALRMRVPPFFYPDQ